MKAVALKIQYRQWEQGACWPTDMMRAHTLYGAMSRGLKARCGKEALLKATVGVAEDCDKRYAHITASQTAFKKWFEKQVSVLEAVPFEWEVARKRRHSRKHPSFGMAQKLVSLVTKDFWASNSMTSSCDCSVFYAPFDRIMGETVSRYTRDRKLFPCLRTGTGGWTVALTREEYWNYQEKLDVLGSSLQAALGFDGKLARIEVEQLIWGWTAT